MQERERDREYDLTRAANSSNQWHAVTERLSLPIHIENHHALLMFSLCVSSRVAGVPLGVG